MTDQQRERIVDLLYKVIKQVHVKSIESMSLSQVDRDLIVKEFLEGMETIIKPGDHHG